MKVIQFQPGVQISTIKVLHNFCPGTRVARHSARGVGSSLHAYVVHNIFNVHA